MYYLYDIISGNKLYNDFYGYGTDPIDPTLFERLKYLHPEEMQKEIHIIAFRGQTLIGDAALQVNPCDENIFWLKHVIVDSEHQNKGISKNLINIAFEHSQKNNMKMEISYFSKIGKSYLQNFFIELYNNYPGKIIPNSDMKEIINNQDSGLKL